MFIRAPRVCRTFVLAPLLGALLALTACGSARISEENTRLRREHFELTQKVKQLEEDAGRRDAQFAALEKRLNAPKPAVEGVGAGDLPVVSKVEFGAYSGVLDDDGDGMLDKARVYLHTLDQRGRFLPAAGKAVMQVVLIDPAGGAKEIARAQLSPKAFESAYVSGITGTHFTLECDIAPPLPKSTRDVTIKVTFTDAATGEDFAAQTAGPQRKQGTASK